MIRLRAAIWSVVAVSLVLGCVAVLQFARTPVQTDLLALLPVTERNPVVERAVSGLVDAGGRRAVFLIGHAVPERAKELADRFAQTLSAADVFKQVRARFPAPDAAALRAIYYPHRFHLLSDEDRQALASASPGREFVDTKLQRRLYDPFRRGFGMPLEQDPLGTLDGYLASLPFAQLAGALEIDDRGKLSVSDAGRTHVVVLAELNGSAYDGALQERFTALYANAEQAVREQDRDVTVLRTGAIHYASAGRELAERELNIIGLGSLFGIAILLYATFRSFRPMTLGILSVGIGIAAAMLATIGVFGEIHIITLVFGASLTGEAVDYSIQYFAARLDAGKRWSAERGLRSVLPAIVIAIITSILGYSALALTPFPALRQIALFSIVGLVVACLTVVLLLPAFLQKPVTRPPRALLQFASNLLVQCRAWGSVRARVLLAAVLILLALPGWIMLKAQDDIRLLVNPPAQLVEEEGSIRRLTGFSQSSQLFVVQGANQQEVLEREERLTARLRALQREGALKGYQAVSDFVPSAVRQQESYALWRDRVFTPAGSWQAVLARYGFKPDIATRHARAFRRAAAPMQLDTWLQSPLSTPFRHLWVGAVDSGAASLVTPSGFDSVAVLERAAADLPGVTLVDKAGSVSRLFREYRFMGSVALLIAAALVLGVLWVRYGRREALQGMVPTLLGIGVALACFGYLGTPLTMFSVMALLLVLGVSVNYVIFLREGAARSGAALLGVLLSAATTVLSFGLLGWSSTPALAQFGSTLFMGIVVTVVLAPLLGPLGPDVRGVGQK